MSSTNYVRGIRFQNLDIYKTNVQCMKFLRNQKVHFLRTSVVVSLGTYEEHAFELDQDNSVAHDTTKKRK